MTKRESLARCTGAAVQRRAESRLRSLRIAVCLVAAAFIHPVLAPVPSFGGSLLAKGKPHKRAARTVQRSTRCRAQTASANRASRQAEAREARPKQTFRISPIQRLEEMVNSAAGGRHPVNIAYTVSGPRHSPNLAYRPSRAETRRNLARTARDLSNPRVRSQRSSGVHYSDGDSYRQSRAIAYDDVADRDLGAPSSIGAFFLDIRPDNAEVYVNGEKRGQARDFDGSPDYLWLETGVYELILYLPGYETFAGRFTIRDGVVSRISKALQRGRCVRPDSIP